MSRRAHRTKSIEHFTHGHTRTHTHTHTDIKNGIARRNARSEINVKIETAIFVIVVPRIRSSPGFNLILF